MVLKMKVSESMADVTESMATLDVTEGSAQSCDHVVSLVGARKSFGDNMVL